MTRTLRTALAALIAALSVAVIVVPMASAQSAPSWTGEPAPCILPPFADNLPLTPPLTASLTITPVYDEGHFVAGHNVRVSGVLRTSSIAEAVRLYSGGWRASYRLWGEDPNGDDQYSPDGDDMIGPRNTRFDYVIQGDRCEGRVYFYSSRYYKKITTANPDYLPHWWDINEDFWDRKGSSLDDRDEIYADVLFGNYRMQTQTVYGYF